MTNTLAIIAAGAMVLVRKRGRQVAEIALAGLSEEHIIARCMLDDRARA